MMTREMSATELAGRLQSASPVVAPSLLACDFGALAAEVRDVERSGARLLHLDVMDGHFVPNLSFGLPVVETVRRLTELPLDVHLMITNPADYLEAYRRAGADILTFHAEVVDDPRPLLDRVRSLGALAGLSLNPPTPLEKIEAAVPYCDLILVMSVMPGFGGQAFDPRALERLAALRDDPRRTGLLEVDGGVNDSTAGPCAAAGADVLVAGTAVFASRDRAARIAQLQQLARDARG